jgi:hypothetical protein
MDLKRTLTVIGMLSLFVVCGQAYAQVYKTVDENGNVVYTDQPPKDGSPPIELKPLSVIEAPEYARAEPGDAQEDEPKQKSIRFLRKHYEGFGIVSPQQEESVWYADGPVAVAWSAPNPLEPGMQVTVAVDGRAQPATREPVVAFVGLERGEHTATAELRDAGNRLIASSEPITFFIRQPNIYMNAPRPTPRGN